MMRTLSRAPSGPRAGGVLFDEGVDAVCEFERAQAQGAGRVDLATLRLARVVVAVEEAPLVERVERAVHLRVVLDAQECFDLACDVGFLAEEAEEFPFALVPALEE